MNDLETDPTTLPPRKPGRPPRNAYPEPSAVVQGKRTCDFLVRKMSRDIHDHFKALCARKGVTMTSELIRLMREAIRKEA